MNTLVFTPVSYTHLDVYKRQRQGIVFKVLYYRYYNFDLDQPFQPQYEQNNRHLLADLHRIAGEQ